MDIYGLLFERNGRIGRMTFVAAVLMTNIVSLFLTNAFARFATFETLRISFIFMMVIMIANLLVQINLMVKRLHDVDMSGWWVLYLYVLMVSLNMIGNGFEYVGNVAAIAFYLFLIVVPGIKGETKFDKPDISSS